jgi:hypothetical protein
MKLNPGLPPQKQHFDLKLRKELPKCYIWGIAVYGAATCTLRKVDQKYLENFEK